MSISIVLLPCTGRIEEAVLLRAFEKGADGVMVIGCLEGDCHYVNGNIRARARVGRVAGILETIGFGPERVRMYNLSAGEGAAFARFTGEFVDQVQTLGPSPINLARGQQNQESTEEVAAT
ncbi:Coenzyme F420-reducing hydrogenase, delta subunit [Desulfofustis glycolicus DSM 9705]|uniref:Coenzyme F420-reducing hydrogenase, delta subunit n=1 Tax=Desulfofustis glycolicus DSM 9705 TaxID=1121409 RepID=A0A1M5TPE7_9BACT|nr:Coenzyme F420-reducing hydrogenase, delta subunit [Desulfofustis glycolicus DSM 9705]